jgi:hypothetical protein
VVEVYGVVSVVSKVGGEEKEEQTSKLGLLKRNCGANGGPVTEDEHGSHLGVLQVL